ncbi:MAG TPA: fibronectin type III domain-containing protein [Pyrinomonadaceae bacterium]|nr:fibronectin type III domain-containing protein [Pyrinomonadaceae bacterium]
MRKRFLTLTLSLALTAASALLLTTPPHPAAAQGEAASPRPQVSRAVGYAKTAPARTFEERRAAVQTGQIKGENPPRQIRRVPNQGLPKEQNREGQTHGTDAAVQNSYRTNAVTSEPLIPTPETSFEGLSSDNNAAVLGVRYLPPDTVGDIGPNHYVQAVNTLVRVFDRAGAPLTGAFLMSQLFAAVGAPCGTTDDGDPIVLYDQAADRWLISQFVASAPYHQCIAISASGDPTGAYHAYAFQMPNNKFNDYPHFGVWPDGYYMSDNQFTNFFAGAGVFAFDRAKMLAGDPSASYIYFDLATNDGGMLPSDWDGTNAPPAGSPNYFAQFTAGEFGDPSDAMRIWEFRANFSNPAASTFTEHPASPVPVAAFNPTNPSGRLDIEQPSPASSSSYLDSLQDRLMHRLQYRNFGTHESLVVTHTVNVGTGTTVSTHRASVRYYEFRRAGGAWAVNEEATFAPNDGLNRWMGSAAMNGHGDIAVGYSVSSTTVFPGIRYAGRLATDPPGGLFQGEAVLINGSGSQTSTSGRWGDYSSLNVDPVDDCTFWYTTEYYSASSSAGWRTRIGKFKVGGCGPPPPAPAAPSGLTATATGSDTVSLAWADNSDNEGGFRVERCAGAGCTNFATAGQTGAGATSFGDTGLSPGTTYTYRVVAFNAGGDSAPSNTASATTQALPPPAAPTNLSVTSVSKNSVGLAWNDNSTNETGFQLERCTGTTCTNFALVASPLPNVTTYTDTGRARRTTYRYRVRAVNGAGPSAYSNIVSATTR